MWLGSVMAVAVVEAGSCSSDSTPHLGTFACCTCGPKKKKDRDVRQEASYHLIGYF